MDDLLLCSPSLSVSQDDTSTLLSFLGAKGYQVPPSKALNMTLGQPITVYSPADSQSSLATDTWPI